LIRTATETRQNTDAIATLRDETRIKVGNLANAVEVGINGIATRQWQQISEKIAKLEDASEARFRNEKALIARTEQLKNESDKLGIALVATDTVLHQAVKEIKDQTGKNVADINLAHVRLDAQKLVGEGREERQIARDQNNVQALVNLRDSTAKAFNQVRDDVAALMKQIQRLNERVGQTESQNKILADAFLGPNAVINQSVVNSKLSGVYNVTEELDKRIQTLETGPYAAFHHMVGIEKRVAEVEAEIAIITDFRRAQAAFILGPSKAPSVKTNESA